MFSLIIGRLWNVLISHFYLNLRESATPPAGRSASSPSQMPSSLHFGWIVGELGSTSLGAAEDSHEPAVGEADEGEGVDAEDDHAAGAPEQNQGSSLVGERTLDVSEA